MTANTQSLGYIRVSTYEQNTERQLEGIELDMRFEDKLSGKSIERPSLQALIKHARKGDVVHCHDISRMARNVKDLILLIDTFIANGVTVKFHKESLVFKPDSKDPMQTLMLQMLGSVYEFERSMMLERQKEGIAIAKKKGVYKGRPTSVSRTDIMAELNQGTSIRKTAAKLGCGSTTVTRVKKELQADIKVS